MTFGIHPTKVTQMVDFLLVDQPSAYNAIIDRPTLNALRAVVSTYHLAMKLLAEDQVREVRGDQAESQQCYAMSTKVVEKQKAVNTLFLLEDVEAPTRPKQHLPHSRRAQSPGKGKGKNRRTSRGAGIH